MNIIYVGLNLRWQSYRFLPDGINVMLSAAGMWQGNGWRRDRYPREVGNKFVDPGGFTALNRFGDYPFSTVQFLNIVAFLRPHYYGSLDYPCEPEIARGGKLTTNAERIRATVANARLALDLVPMVGNGSRCVPVIQGYTLDEYKECIELHAQAGTLEDYMAVGSMCRRIDNAELHRLIPGITEYARQGNVTRLHWFGLKLSPALADLREFIYSRDSAVALDDYDDTQRQARQGRRWPRGQQEKRQAFYSFIQRVEAMGLKPTAGNGEKRP